MGGEQMRMVSAVRFITGIFYALGPFQDEINKFIFDLQETHPDVSFGIDFLQQNNDVVAAISYVYDEDMRR